MSPFQLMQKKQRQEKISFITCYDYPSARIVAESPIDAILVGDSVAMTVYGHPSTVTATMPMMLAHTQAVAKGLGSQWLVSDLPFLSYRAGLNETMTHVRSLMQAGAHAIKLEGGDPDACHTIEYLVQAGINVVGHIGLTPQSIHQLGGFKIQGRRAHDAQRLEQEALALEQAGCCALVLECIPQHLAQTITQSLQIPTIGIGAGIHTDGQILVWHDVLGLQTDFHPKFLKQYASLHPSVLQALNQYHQEVMDQQFPTYEHSYD